jgi:hypothetical protein
VRLCRDDPDRDDRTLEVYANADIPKRLEQRKKPDCGSVRNPPQHQVIRTIPTASDDLRPVENVTVRATHEQEVDELL